MSNTEAVNEFIRVTRAVLACTELTHLRDVWLGNQADITQMPAAWQAALTTLKDGVKAKLGVQAIVHGGKLPASEAPDIPDEPKVAEKPAPEPIAREETYARIVRAMRNADSLETLGQLWKLKQQELKMLPANWQVELTAEKDRIKAQLQAKEAA